MKKLTRATKRFLVPAVFVIHAANSEEAEAEAAIMQTKANSIAILDNILFLDEELPTTEVEIRAGETELPHTYRTLYIRSYA